MMEGILLVLLGGLWVASLVIAGMKRDAEWSEAMRLWKSKLDVLGGFAGSPKEPPAPQRRRGPNG